MDFFDGGLAGDRGPIWHASNHANPNAWIGFAGNALGATVALLAGGALKGGRVIADWPGVAEGKLYENRDLMATTDLRAVMKGVLQDQFGLTERVLAETVFPDSAPVKPMNISTMAMWTR